MNGLWKVVGRKEQAMYEWGEKPFPRFYEVGLRKYEILESGIYGPVIECIYFLRPFHHIVRFVRYAYLTILIWNYRFGRAALRWVTGSPHEKTECLDKYTRVLLDRYWPVIINHLHQLTEIIMKKDK